MTTTHGMHRGYVRWLVLGSIVPGRGGPSLAPRFNPKARLLKVVDSPPTSTSPRLSYNIVDEIFKRESIDMRNNNLDLEWGNQIPGWLNLVCNLYVQSHVRRWYFLSSMT
jgi:hypothetical protein